MDFAAVQTEEGKQYLFVAIDRTSKVAFAELHPHAKRVVAAEFLRRVLDKLPYKGHTVLTDNGVQFTPQAHQFLPVRHRSDRICRQYGVEHRLTKPAHPWTNGQVERMNRTIKEATVRRYHTSQRTNSTSTCKPSCWPTTTPNASRPYAASRRTNSCALNGRKITLTLTNTQPTSRWDYTPRTGGQSRIDTARSDEN